FEAARAKNAKAIEELNGWLRSPEASRKARTVVGALLGASVVRFLSENILSDIEIDAVRSLWAKSRHPDVVARLAILENDERALALGAAALQTFQRGCSDPSIVAGNLPGVSPAEQARRLDQRSLYAARAPR